MQQRAAFENNSRWIDGRGSYRRLAFERYLFEKKCTVCGKRSDLDVHHRNRDRHNNTRENLVVLCGTCHNKLHKRGSKQPHITKIRKGKSLTEIYGVDKSTQIRKKLSASLTGEKNPFYGAKWTEHGGHPKGMLGKKHSAEAKAKITKTLLTTWKKKKSQ